MINQVVRIMKNLMPTTTMGNGLQNQDIRLRLGYERGMC